MVDRNSARFYYPAHTTLSEVVALPRNFSPPLQTSAEVSMPRGCILRAPAQGGVACLDLAN
jgi:hypothetical protein